MTGRLHPARHGRRTRQVMVCSDCGGATAHDLYADMAECTQCFRVRRA